MIQGVSAPLSVLSGSKQWLAEALAGDIEEDEAKYRIQQYIRSMPKKPTNLCSAGTCLVGFFFGLRRGVVGCRSVIVAGAKCS